MKKLSIFIVIALFAYISVNAQGGVSFGVRVVPTLDWTTLSDTGSTYSFDNNGVKLGIGFGPSLRYELSDNFNIDISGIFTWQKFGVDQKNEITNPTLIDRTEDFKVQFFKIPLNFNGQFDVAGNLQALINFGAGVGIKLTSSRVITDHINPDRYSTDYETAAVLNFIDLYLTAGAGVVYNIEDNLHLSLTVQYNNGILDAWINSNNEAPSSIQELSLKHRNIAFNIGFYIDI